MTDGNLSESVVPLGVLHHEVRPYLSGRSRLMLDKYADLSDRRLYDFWITAEFLVGRVREQAEAGTFPKDEAEGVAKEVEMMAELLSRDVSMEVENA